MSQAEHAKHWEQHPNGGDVLPINNLILVPAACFIYKGKTWNRIKGRCPFASHNLLPLPASAFPCELVRHIPEQLGLVLGGCLDSGRHRPGTLALCTSDYGLYQGLEDDGLSQERSC